MPRFRTSFKRITPSGNDDENIMVKVEEGTYECEALDREAARAMAVGAAKANSGQIQWATTTSNVSGIPVSNGGGLAYIDGVAALDGKENTFQSLPQNKPVLHRSLSPSSPGDPHAEPRSAEELDEQVEQQRQNQRQKGDDGDPENTGAVTGDVSQGEAGNSGSNATRDPNNANTTNKRTRQPAAQSTTV